MSTRLPTAAPFACLALCAALLAGCQRYEEPGPDSAQTRELEPFHEIELRGAGTLEIAIGAPQAVVLEGSAAALENIQTRVRNGRLVIDSKQKWFWGADSRLKARVTVARLEELELAGASSVSIQGLAGGELDVDLAGAGSVQGSGRLDRLEAEVNGAGSMDLARLEVQDARVTVNGTGSVDLDVRGRLEATVNGVGSVTYAGKPRELKTSINGVGSIKPR